MVGGALAHGKLPFTVIFKPPLPVHPVIIPQGKVTPYLDQSNFYKHPETSASGFVNNAYGNTQAGLAKRVYRKQGPKTDALQRNSAQYLEWAKSFIPLSSDKTVLEVNAGTAVFSRYLLPHVKSVTASDVSRHMLKQAKDTAGDKITTVVADSNSLPFEDESFDIVISRFALSQFEKPINSIKQMARVVKSGGHVVIIERVPHPSIAVHTNRLNFFENIRDPSHFKFYDPESISSFLVKSGLDPQQSATIFGELATAHTEVHQEFGQYLDLTNTRFQNKLLLTQAVEANADYPDNESTNQVSGYQPFFEDNKLYITETHALFIARK